MRPAGEPGLRRGCVQTRTRLVRYLWVALCAALIAPATALAAAGEPSAPSPRLATLDWGIAQNLIAMGESPIAVGQPDGYNTWVGEPPLPAGTHSLGLRAQPNLEMLAQLDPDRILITRMYAASADKLAEVAPVSTVDVYFTPGGVWDNTVAAVKKLGQLAHRPAAANALIQRTEANLDRAAARLPDNLGPVLVVQLVDSQHVRVYGKRSLIQAAMQRMGVANAWQRDTTRWGMASASLADLADIKQGRVVVMGPVPVGVAQQYAHNRLWQSLPIVRNAPVVYIPPVWSFGGLPSASRFARLLANAFAHPPADGAGWPATSDTRS